VVRSHVQKPPRDPLPYPTLLRFANQSLDTAERDKNFSKVPLSHVSPFSAQLNKVETRNVAYKQPFSSILRAYPPPPSPFPFPPSLHQDAFFFSMKHETFTHLRSRLASKTSKPFGEIPGGCKIHVQILATSELRRLIESMRQEAKRTNKRVPHPPSSHHFLFYIKIQTILIDRLSAA
jgi:hypothetical protein